MITRTSCCHMWNLVYRKKRSGKYMPKLSSKIKIPGPMQLQEPKTCNLPLQSNIFTLSLMLESRLVSFEVFDVFQLSKPKNPPSYENWQYDIWEIELPSVRK